MPDYGHDLLFGVFIPPLAEYHDAVLDLGRRADELGLDLIGVQDHPYQPRFLDTWTLLATLAAETQHIRLFPDVANLPLRPPMVLARTAASLDLLSGGRVELGIGAGAFWDAIEANGGPRRTAGESVDALAEAIAVIRALWSDEPEVDVGGVHYTLRGAQPGPAPAHPIGIWVGSYQPRMLRLTGRMADGWIPSSAYLAPSDLPASSRVIDEAARRAGRDPAEIRRLYNVNGDFSADDGGFLHGPPRVWTDQLAGLALEDGISGFVLSVQPGVAGDMLRFAEEVAPAVREVVERERAARNPAATRAAARPEAPAPAGIDDATRPRGEREPAADASETDSAGARLLLQVHDHLRGELAQLREALVALESGQRDAAWVRSVLARLTVRQNTCSVGAFCAAYCRMVTIHHAIEDQRLFPDIRQADESLEPILARLQQEHEVIAKAIEEVDEALAAMMADPSRIEDVKRGVGRLGEVLLSHLSYEEDELLEPIARLAIVV